VIERQSNVANIAALSYTYSKVLIINKKFSK